ncbi:glycosyltransferase family 2 protein [Rhodococcus sp. BP-252]|uniref:glycosyltransferase family 2 protein n=1 Tax=unclassified Rhodococcus (in: high G+C Gram-positive bacteria) TaxID=192944 RepID=UPI001C9B16E3|nr:MULTISPECIES: glycosyltransferase family A protein [unclassified Rhodococcus (in: high G+C Gram-positive bacteria)]MBY6410635.1 glycosyltransferase family 2 protein [Rhodococcus sp. BP-320]MBY6415540.1 glycosyltransferase family 2 protein [Rhodococcus sp. BP-321]MBY6420155.1 glycosyltransferase family 2 protein [Rhodococcus sp. BP-324]MBY6425191.1 glycosyltransferase family 2 protein [Rhodococcus sp. BP-323]MBY6430746.1 glycosyltransferase family 2 protein [Rhodococcus sp. BP-322]
MSPRVSVVVPAYNNAEYIGETIESILGQTFTDFELIIADHSSTDGTMTVVEKYDDPRIRVLTTEAGGGAKRNWDRVTAEASGELIKLVCGDDTILSTSLAAQVAAFDEHPSAVLVASQRTLIDAYGKTFIAARGLDGLSGLTSGRDAARAAVRAGANIFGEPGCVMMKREVLERIGLWDNAHPYLIDQATFIGVALHGDVVAIPQPLATFRINSGQWSVELATEQARQAADFHRSLSAAHPGLLSAADVRLGNAKALATSFMRRGVYLLLRNRMSR